MSEQDKQPKKSKSGLVWKIIIWGCLYSFLPWWLFLIILIAYGIWHLGSSSQSSPEQNIISELPEEDAPEIDSGKMFPADQGLDIPSCVTYFAQLKRKYLFSEDTWVPIRQKLIHIKKRYNDPLLYLGIIGEASAGKSTFINALLGIEFLKEDTSLGTTAAATIIKYDKEFSVKINYTDKSPSVYLDTTSLKITSTKEIIDNSQKILDFVHKYTADESVAENIYSVEISLPLDNKFLRSDVAIVDTPGLNSGNQRHDEVTTRTIKEICDTALILVPANVPLSKNLGIYVRENLSDVLSRCVLVMTQADTLRREKERSMQLSYISKRLQSATGEQVAASFTSSAYYVLERDDYGKCDNDTVASFREEFFKMSENLHGILSTGRTTAVTQNILIFLKNDLLPVLKNLLESQKLEYTQRSKALKDNQLFDLDNFLSQKTDHYQAKISNVIISEQAIISAIDSVRDNFYKTISKRIDNASDRDELKSAMNENYIRSKIAELQRQLKDSLTIACAPLQKATGEALQDFHQKFVEAYKRLQKISDFSSASNISNVSTKGMDVKISIEDFGDKVDTQLGADVMKAAGGAGAGALIGSFICPGLGTALGAGLGALVGFIFRKSLDELKSEARSSIWSIANDWKNQMIMPSHSYTDQYKQACVNLVKDRIAKYQSTYGNKISQLIATERSEQEKLLSFTRFTEMDIDLLGRMKPKAEEMLLQLKTASSQNVEAEN